MFTYSTLLFLLSVLSATALAHPSPTSVYAVDTTTAPILAQRATTATTLATPVSVTTTPTAYPSFCCAYNNIKYKGAAWTNYTLNLAGFGNTDSTSAHDTTNPSTDGLCAPGLDDAINAKFDSAPGYEFTITCLPSYGGTNDTYVYMMMIVPTADQGGALLDIVVSN